MPAFTYICPRCHHRLECSPGARPERCPACELPITRHELTLQEQDAARLLRRTLTFKAVSFLFWLVVAALVAAFVFRLAKN